MNTRTDQKKHKPMDKLTGQDDIIRAFKRAIYESKEAQSSEVAEADRNWKYYFGQHYLRNVGGRWMADSMGGDKLRIQRDIIQLAIDALRPILVKMRPHILVLATYPEDDVVVEMPDNSERTIRNLKNADVSGFLTEALKREHRRRHEEILLSELILEVMITGQAYRVCLPVTRPGFGTMIEPKLYPRSRVLLDYEGTRLADFKDFQHVIFEDELNANEIFHTYGVKESEYTKEDEPSSDALLEYEGYDHTVGGIRRLGRRLEEDGYDNRPRKYKVHTGYFNEGASELETYHDAPPKSLKFPFGRQLVMINEQYLQADQPNPFWHGDYPVTCYQSLPVPHVARALSESGKLIDVQKGVNILMNALIGNTLLGQNPKLLYEEGAFNPEDWGQGPGGMVRVTGGALSGGKIQWFKPEGTDRGAFNLLKDLEYYGKEDVAGVTASLQGQQLPAGSSGVYANTLQSAAMTGPTFRIQQLDSGHHRFARQEVELYQQFVDWREPYYLEIHDMEKYHPYMTEAVQDLYYRVEYESQAELPHNPIARQNFFWNQFVEGIIDFEEYVQKSHISMRPELRERARKGSMDNYMPGVPREVRLQMMMQAAQAQAAMQAQASQGGGGALPGGEPPSQIAGQSAEEGASVGGLAGDPEGSAL